jgi:hypothetical protein
VKGKEEKFSHATRLSRSARKARHTQPEQRGSMVGSGEEEEEMVTYCQRTPTKWR